MLHIRDEAEEAFPGQGSTEGNEDQDEEMEDDFDPGQIANLIYESLPELKTEKGQQKDRKGWLRKRMASQKDRKRQQKDRKKIEKRLQTDRKRLTKGQEKDDPFFTVF